MWKRMAFLAFWLTCMLFPMSWLRRESPGFRQRFDAVFRLEWAHVVMHLLLFAGLAILLIYALQLPLNRKTVTGLLVFVMLVGVGQELLQLWAKERVWGWAEYYDLGVDLLGAGAGIALVKARRDRNERVYRRMPDN